MHTRETLAADLEALGLTPGRTVLVHAAMRAVGRVAGPPRAAEAADPVAAAVLGALRDVLGPRGTVVVPAFTEQNSTTSRVHRERIRGMSPEEVAGYRSSMAPFDPGHTPADGMGRLAETVRRSPGALRSAHPQTSFAALGAAAAAVVGGHDEECHLGEDSPLARLHESGALILMIGVGYGVCSAFHLAEYRIPEPPRRDYTCVVRRGGKAEWITYSDVDLDDSDFADLGTAYEKSDTDRAERRLCSGEVGGAQAQTFELPDAVDFAVGWLTGNRSRRTGPRQPGA